MIRLRDANVEDVPLIRAIPLGTWPDAYRTILSPAQLAYTLDLMYSEAALNEQLNKGHRFLIADHDDVPTGFAGYEHHHRGSHNSRLHKLYVLPKKQGTGSGKTLLKAVEEVSRRAGDAALELNVNRFNRSKDFYLRNDFRIVREEVIDIGEGYMMDDCVMEKQLT